jgi:hypothetical protein
MTGAVHGELGQRGGEGVGVRLRYWLGMAVWAWQAAWAVVLEASRRQLALTRLHHNGALQVFDRRVAGRGGVASRSEGQRESWRAPKGSWLPPLPTRVS